MYPSLFHSSFKFRSHLPPNGDFQILVTSSFLIAAFLMRLSTERRCIFSRFIFMTMCLPCPIHVRVQSFNLNFFFHSLLDWWTFVGEECRAGSIFPQALWWRISLLPSTVSPNLKRYGRLPYVQTRCHSFEAIGRVTAGLQKDLLCKQMRSNFF